jgi:hypothetical protein
MQERSQNIYARLVKLFFNIVFYFGGIMSENIENREVDYQIIETEFVESHEKLFENDKEKKLAEFRKKIINLLNKGYVPVGGITVSVNPVQYKNPTRYTQVLTKGKEVSK